MEATDHMSTLFFPSSNNLQQFSFGSAHDDKYRTAPLLPPFDPASTTTSTQIQGRPPRVTPTSYPEDRRRVKRPPNAYMLFRSWCCRNRAVNVGGKDQNLNATIPALWKALPSAQRAPWMQLANKMKREHGTQYLPRRRRNANGRVSVAVSSTTSLPQHGSARLPTLSLDQANAVHNEPSLQAVPLSGSFLTALSSALPPLAPNDGVPFPASSAIVYWPSTSSESFSPSFSPAPSLDMASSSISGSWPSSQHIPLSSPTLDIPHNTLGQLASVFTGPSDGDPYVYGMPSSASALSESGTEFDVNHILGAVSQPFPPKVATSDNEIMIYFRLGEQGRGIQWPWEPERTDEAPVAAGAPYDNFPLAAAAFEAPCPTSSSLPEPMFTGESVAEGDFYVNAASSSTTQTVRPGAGHSNLDFSIDHIMEHPFPAAEALDNAAYFEVDEYEASMWLWAEASLGAR